MTRIENKTKKKAKVRLSFANVIVIGLPESNKQDLFFQIMAIYLLLIESKR